MAAWKIDGNPPVAANADTSMQTLTLVHSESFPIGRYADALRRESIFSRPVTSLDELNDDAGSLRVILLGPVIYNGRPSSFDGRMANLGVGLEEEHKGLPCVY